VPTARVDTTRVVVVGAGFGGLAAALRLRAAGLDVTVLERESRPGGRAGRLESHGFSFDTGPSVLTMPELFSELFALYGEDMADSVSLTRLDPAYRAVFHDGSILHVRGSVEAMEQEVREVCGPAEAARFADFARHLRALYDAEYDGFIDGNFDSVRDLARPGRLLRLARLGGFRRVAPLVAAHLKDWRLQRLFTFQSMYAGMSPYKALGVYAVIAYMDVIAGVYAATGGVHALVTALAGLADRAGIEVRLSTPVARVSLAAGRATGVVTEAGERIPADAVVLNPDLPIAYRDLLPPSATPPRVHHLRYSPSCVVAHLGLDRPLEGAAHHNIHFAQGYRESFDDLLSGRMQRDASWFLSVPTVSDPELAPPGGAVGFYLLPTPNLQGAPINWDAQGPRELSLAQERIEAAGYGPVRPVVSEVVTPADWERQGMAAGTPFAASHTFFQTGPFRPRNLAPRVGGVVFTGSSTTPGVGVPMVLVSGKLAAQRVLAEVGLIGKAGRPPVQMAGAPT